MTDTERISLLEARLAKLEKLECHTSELPAWQFWTAAVLGAASCGTAYYAVGLPNHFFQILFGVFVVVMAHMRGWIFLPSKWIHAILIPFNLYTVSSLSKIFLGTGKRMPFSWFQFPTLEFKMPPGKFTVIPDVIVGWLPTPLTGLAIDFTRIQALLLIVLVLGITCRLELLVSVSFLVLVVVSMPSLMTYSWEWLFPAVILFTLLLAVQAPLLLRKAR